MRATTRRAQCNPRLGMFHGLRARGVMRARNAQGKFAEQAEPNSRVRIANPGSHHGSTGMPEDFRAEAAACLCQSHRAKDIQSKVLLLRLAQNWIELAERLRAPAPEPAIGSSSASRPEWLQAGLAPTAVPVDLSP